MELKKSTCFDDDDFRPAPPFVSGDTGTTKNSHDQSFPRRKVKRHLRRRPSELEKHTANQGNIRDPPGPWAHSPAPVLDGRTWRSGSDAPAGIGRASQGTRQLLRG